LHTAKLSLADVRIDYCQGGIYCRGHPASRLRNVICKADAGPYAAIFPLVSLARLKE